MISLIGHSDQLDDVRVSGGIDMAIAGVDKVCEYERSQKKEKGKERDL